MRSFSEMSKAKQYSEDYYPHALTGIKLSTTFFLNLERMIIFGVITLIFKILTSYLAIDGQKSKKVAQSIKEFKLSKSIEISDVLSYIGFNVTKWVTNINLIIFLIFTSIVLITFVLYIFNVIQRQRNYERSVIKNDFVAFFLKRRILGSKDAKIHLRDEKRELRRKKEGNNRLTKKDKIPLEAQKEFMKMLVMVNSRESLDEKGIIDTQYRIIFYIPNDSEVAAEVDKKIDDINTIATRQMRSKVTFGKKFDLEGKNAVVFRAWSQKEDKYNYSDIEEDESDESTQPFEYSYPLSMLRDQQDKIDQTKVIAEQYTKRNLATVKAFLATSKIDCTFKKYEVGNAMASYIFVMADDVTLPQFDKLGDTLDNMMKKKGSDVTLDQGNLVVSIPLIDEARVPINVPTMYREMFGE